MSEMIYEAAAAMMSSNSNHSHPHPGPPPHHGHPMPPFPGHHHVGITHKGENFAWFVYVVMLASALAVTVWGLLRPVGKRTFHWIGVSILFTAAMSYYAMATGLGVSTVMFKVPRLGHDNRHPHQEPVLRAVYYARYLDWTVTTPLLLLELLLATGLPFSEILLAIFMDLFMIIGGLIGSFVGNGHRWGWFSGATVAMLFIFYLLMFPARKAAFRIGDDIGKPYTTSTLILLVLWTLYPIAWGLADGGNKITADTEMIFYGVLDVLAKPVFLFVHLFALQGVDLSRFGLGGDEGRLRLADDDDDVPAATGRAARA